MSRPLAAGSLSIEGEECDIDIPFRVELSEASYSLHVEILWDLVLIVFYCKKLL